MPAASIIVELLMKTASFITDNDRATKSLEKLKKEAYDTGKQIGSSLNSVGSVIGITLTIAGLTALVKSAVDAADHLNDLSKRTGIAVETLGGLGFAGSMAGADLDSVAAAAGKLNKQIAAAGAGNEDAISLFKTMGISVRDAAGQLKTADQVIVEMAGHFETWEEGPEKGALAVKAFGKAGEAMIPLLDDGARALRDNIAYFQRYGGITTEVAGKADAFNDTLGKISLLQGAFGRNLAAELLPALQSLAERFLEAKEKGDGLKSTAEDVATAFKGLATAGAFVVATVAIVGDTVGALAAQIGALFRVAESRNASMTLTDRLLGRAPMLSVDEAKRAQGQLNAVGVALEEDIRKNVDRFNSLSDAINKTAQKPALLGGFNDRRFSGGGTSQKTRAPLLPDKGAAGQAAAEAQKIYDAQVQAARDFGAQQKATFSYANKLLDGVFDEGLTSLRSFYDQQEALRSAALASSLKAIDLEIAARRQEAGDSRLNPVQRLDAQNKLAEAERKRAEAVVDAARDETVAREGQLKAFEQYAERFIDLQAQLAEASGDERLSASLRISRQIVDAQRLLVAIGADPGIAEQLRAQLEAKADLAKLQTDYGRLVERSANAEAAAILSAQEGNRGEIDTLRAVGAERAKALVQLGALVDKANELVMQNPTQEAIANAERLSAAYAKAAAEVDPLLQHIRDVGGEVGQAIASGLTDAVLAGDNLTDTLKGIDKALSRIALNELFEKPLAEWLRGVVGGNGQQSGGGGIIGSVADWLKQQMSGSGGGSSGAGAGWLSSAGSWLAGLFGGGMADGGATMPNTLYRVGERGPELYDDGRHQLLLTGSGRGRIDPNPNLGSSEGGPRMVVKQQFLLQGRVDRSTQQQIGARAARGLRLANARGN